MTRWFVSRHAGAHDWLAARGLSVDRQIAHLDLEQVAPGDLVIAAASVANEGTSRQYLGGANYSPTADFAVTTALANAAASNARPLHVGLIQTEDAFYATTPAGVPAMAARGVLAIEMEASALFTLGALRGVATGCILVTSNNIGDERLLAADELKAAVLDMVTVALDAAVALGR